MAESHVVTAQKSLAAIGLYNGALDGDFGKGSLLAVQRLIDNTDKAVEILTNPDGSVEQPQDHNKGFALSIKSLNNLNGVNPDLVKVVKRAIEITGTDFMVNEGLRSRDRQAMLVRKGASQTMNSKHLTGNAVDIVPIVNGKADFANWDHYYPLGRAMQLAAKELGVNVRWGGCWSRINDKTGDPKQWVADYVAARKKMGKSAFIDGPHFDLG